MGVVLGIIVFLLTIATPVIVIVTFVKVCGIEDDMARIKLSLSRDALQRSERKVDEAIVKPGMEGAPLLEAVGTETPTLPEPAPAAEAAPVPESMPESVLESVPELEPVPELESAPESMNQPVVCDEPEMSVFDIFWAKFEDWFCVRGDFAPKGTTREFAVATRWLTRVGAVLLVGAIAYFLVLAIDKGWIGPVQRVYGMMAWGVIGTAFGTWLKSKSERYAILGEVCAAVGLVALYLSFGLGHRYFKPPVIASGCTAFAGLFVATIAAGALSVRLKSLMIAGLALVGGFLVPAICSFTGHDVQLHLYLALLSLGACAVVHFRGWTPYVFAAIGLSLVFSQGLFPTGAGLNASVAYAFYVFEFTLAVAVAASYVKSTPGRLVGWAAVALVVVFVLVKTAMLVSARCTWRGASALNELSWAGALAALAVGSRRRAWGGTPVFIVFSCICAAFALASACIDWWCVNGATVVFLFCLFAALLAELGARCEERALQVLAVVATFVMLFVGFGWFVSCGNCGGGGYAGKLVDRMQCLWPVPALVAFVGWRLGERAFWIGWLRNVSFGSAAALAFTVVTLESSLFGHEFLPVLRGGFVTITWAVVASALLAAGIVRRVKVARLVGLGVLALSVAKLLFVDTSSLATPARVGVFAAVGVLLIAGAFLYLKFKPLFEEEGVDACRQ